MKGDEIKAVLNLQTSYDMKYRSIDWEFLKNYYEMNQIVVINFQIIDMDYEDMKNKGIEAAQILNKLVEKFTVNFGFSEFFWNFVHFLDNGLINLPNLRF